MTATNAILQRDRAHLYTDSAMYDETGHIHAFVCKTYSMPKLKAALAVRGLARIGSVLSFDIQRDFATFDELHSRRDDYLSEWFAAAAGDMADLGLTVAEVFVIGWSECRNAPEGFQFETATMACRPFEQGTLVAPFPIEAEWDHLVTLPGFDEDFPRNFDPIAGGIAIMQAQRRFKGQPFGKGRPNSEPKHIIGGHILHTVVTCDGVSQTVIHDWADVAHEEIKPEPMPRSGQTFLPANDSHALDAAAAKRARKAAKLQRIAS